MEHELATGTPPASPRQAPSQDTVNATYPEDLQAPTPFVPMVVPLSLEVSTNLASWFLGDEEVGQRFQQELLPLMREALFYDLGVRVPEVRIRQREDWSPGIFEFSLYDIPIYNGQVSPELLLVGERPERLASLDMEAQGTTHPATGRLVSWVPRQFEERIQQMQVPVWDAFDYIVLVMAVSLRKHGYEFIGVEEVQAMLQLLEPAYPTLVFECRQRLSLPALRRVLRELVREQFSICNLRPILEILVDASESSLETTRLVDAVRLEMKRYLTHRHTFIGRQVSVLQLSPSMETQLLHLIQESSGSVGVTHPLCQFFLGEVAQQLAELPVEIPNPALLCSRSLRRPLKRWLEVHFPFLHVLSPEEIDPHYQVQVFAELRAPEPQNPEDKDT